MDLTPHSFVTSRASGRLLNVVHCSRRITCQNLLFITCFYQSSSAPSAKHWDSLHQAIPGRAPQHAGSGCRAAWNQGGLSQMVLSDIDLHMAALALELCSTIMVDRRSIKNVGLAVRHTILHDTLVFIRSAMLQGQAVQIDVGLSIMAVTSICIWLLLHWSCVPQ